MSHSRAASTGDSILDTMIAMAGCSQHHRIVTAGSKGIELMLQLHRRGYVRAAATANCGQPAGQYDVALVDWRRRTFRALETSLDWLTELLRPGGMLVIWVDPQKPAVLQNLRLLLEKHGFVIESGNVHDYGCTVSARRREMNPLRKAA